MIRWPKKNPSNQITRNEWIEMQKRNQKKNNRSSGHDHFYSKHMIQDEKNTSLYRGNQSRNNMSHNMSQRKMNNIWTS